MPKIIGIDMVQCCRCSEWYLVNCVSVPAVVMEDSVEWFCVSCIYVHNIVHSFVLTCIVVVGK